MTLSIEHIKAEMLPQLFANSAAIAEYGNTAGGAAAINEISDLMESGSVGKLAERIAQIVGKLQDADPERISRPSTWLERLTGKPLERQLRYQVARKSLDELISDTEGIAQRVRDTLKRIDEVISTHTADSEALRLYIQAGREFLDENPAAGEVQEGVVEFDRPRERFARKLANMATLLASNEMSIIQMKMTRAQAVDMLDRYNEAVSVMVPVWRRHTLALITTTNMNSALINEATKAHRALVTSLAKSLEGIKQ
ncbi:toxic anion resistance protein [Burkholderia stabilis]|uniref:toxic anion resistance protein n=1 Tax=Burkholderia stabilis TaxID=95485 RepID=UPI001F4B5F1F|nr:toxic anion resistance protein [Burkholderia stabilis]